ncbi:MAG: hypothetical protein PHP54_03180 [Clostridia bacterium]|nr:hypothetical protein [Clostridia bacterium]
MEIVNLIQKIEAYIPVEYMNLSHFIAGLMPYIFLAFSIVTCFLGYKFHKFWVGVCFAIIGFILGCSLPIFIPQISITVAIIAGILLAILTVVLSKPLYKLQVFFINFFSSYILLSRLLCIFLPEAAGALIGLVLAILVGILAIKYMYIITIITTSVTGSYVMFNQMFYLLKGEHNYIYFIAILVMSVIGAIVQFKTYQNSDKKYKKVEG